MLDDKIRGALDQLIDRTTISFHSVMSSIRIDKADFDIQNESDYALGLAHGMILTGFMSDFKDHNKREPNQLIYRACYLEKRTDRHSSEMRLLYVLIYYDK
jgi:hypothetical protein